MSIDLIDRMIYMNSLGDNKPKERIYSWLKDSENLKANEFIVDNEKFYWRIVSSKGFIDIIDEDETDWFFINSEKRKFKAIAQIRKGVENLIGEKNEPFITTIWIFESDIESIHVGDNPILIYTPYFFESKIDRIDYDFKQLILKLKNPKVKLTEKVSYKISKERTRQIR